MKKSILILSIGILSTAAAGSFYGRYDINQAREGDAPDGKLWALLIAGSNGWLNYRHQADVAHSFHVLKAHGVPEENIITMMYDDIAYNEANPAKGQLFNSPNWVDYYEGLKIDYRGDDVNPDNFLNVLKGNATGVKGGNGRVIESGPNDRVFVYFSDHGTVGAIVFPYNVLLTTKTLNDALNWMHENKRYSDLVFYLESCESGSMFERVLSPDINVYAVTAANSDELSWGTYCENEKGIECLGDLFSVSWLEDSDVEDLTKETIGQQFQLVQKETERSHVSHFGKLDTENDPVSRFQGAKKLEGNEGNVQKSSLQHRLDTAVPSRDIEETSLKRKLRQSNDIYEGKRIMHRLAEIAEKKVRARHTMEHIVSVYDAKTLMENNIPSFFMQKNEDSSIVNYPDCHHDVVHAFRKNCVNPKEDMEYFLPHIYVLNNLCNAEAGKSHDIIDAVIEHCSVETIE